MSEQHDDQLSPVQGVYAVSPDGQIRVTGDVLAEPNSNPVRTEQVVEEYEDGSVQVVEVQAPSVPEGYQPAAPFSDGDTDAILKAAELDRAQLAQPSGNVVHGAPHFLRNVDGVEVCGQDGKPWPCEAYTGLERQGVQRAALPDADLAPPPPTMLEAARAAGIDPVEFQARLAKLREGQ